jgi:hypothetical protein
LANNFVVLTCWLDEIKDGRISFFFGHAGFCCTDSYRIDLIDDLENISSSLFLGKQNCGDSSTLQRQERVLHYIPTKSRNLPSLSTGMITNVKPCPRRLYPNIIEEETGKITKTTERMSVMTRGRRDEAAPKKLVQTLPLFLWSVFKILANTFSDSFSSWSRLQFMSHAQMYEIVG